MPSQKPAQPKLAPPVVPASDSESDVIAPAARQTSTRRAGPAAAKPTTGRQRRAARGKALVDSDSGSSSSGADDDDEFHCSSAASRADDDEDMGSVVSEGSEPAPESEPEIEADDVFIAKPRVKALPGTGTKRARGGTASSPVSFPAKASGPAAVSPAMAAGKLSVQPDNMLPAVNWRAVAAKYRGLAKADQKDLFPAGEHMHNTLGWLYDDRCDASGKRPGEPGYNPRTLRVPQAFLSSQSPAQQQWWQLKADNMDVLLAFKQGKFYELFHFDSDVLVAELDCIYMKGWQAHSGFPEIAWGRFSEALVARGYRVARVEQTETPDALAERRATWDKRNGPKPSVVRREICAIKTAGTRLGLAMDYTSSAERAEARLANDTDSSMPPAMVASLRALAAADPNERWLVAVTEHPLPAAVAAQAPADSVLLGVCCVDCAAATVMMAQFVDGAQRSRLRTLLARHAAAELLTPRGELSATTRRFLNADAPRALCTELAPHTEFLDAEQAATQLCSGRYFVAADTAVSARAAEPASMTAQLPAVLQQAIDRAQANSWDDLSHLNPAAAASADGADLPLGSVAISALGGALWYMQRCLIEHAILGARQFQRYVHAAGQVLAAADTPAASAKPAAPGMPPVITTLPGLAGAVRDVLADSELQPAGVAEQLDAGWHTSQKCVLDAATLGNLEVVANAATGKREGSMLAMLDATVSKGGARLIREWLTRPLARAEDIHVRAAAVDELAGKPELCSAMRAGFKQLPDMARLLARMFRYASKSQAQDHPDSRAVLYELQIYDKRKIADCANVLLAAARVQSARGAAQEAELTSPLLQALVQRAWPDVSAVVDELSGVTDLQAAAKSGKFVPKPGTDADFDEAQAGVSKAAAALDEQLAEAKALLHEPRLKFWGRGKDRFQIEVPAALASSVPDSWELKSQRNTGANKVRRYWSPGVQTAFQDLQHAEATQQSASADALRRLFARFTAHSGIWHALASTSAHLDCLMALAEWSVAGDSGGPLTRAAVMSRVPAPAPGSMDSCTPFTHIQDGRNPMVVLALRERAGRGGTPGQYVPNSVKLGQWTGAAGAVAPRPGAEIPCPVATLVTGSNMGGKSSLLRQTCVIMLLAQLGAAVPAADVVMTPADRISTRVGASDRILAGQSTFFVELAETAAILNTVSVDSLCVLDELGRGTSTFDGASLAGAVTRHLVDTCGARTLFATHYHALCDEFAAHPRVQLAHMAARVSTRADGSANVQFLYQLRPGASPKSHGVHVARLAALPDGVVSRAAARSEAFEAALTQLLPAAATAAAGAASAAALVSQADPQADNEEAAAQAINAAMALASAEQVLALWSSAEQALGDAAGTAISRGGMPAAEAAATAATDAQLIELWRAAQRLAIS